MRTGGAGIRRRLAAMHARPFRIRRRPPTSASWTRSRPEHRSRSPTMPACSRSRREPAASTSPARRPAIRTHRIATARRGSELRPTVPADDVVVRAAADWASELGVKRLMVISDGTPFQSLMDQKFTEAAEERGVQVSRSDDRATGSISTRGGTGAVYDLGTQTINLEDGSPELIASALLDPSRLPDSSFVREFRERFGRDPGPYAAYGYEAMELVLQSISGAGTDASQFRDNVREGVFGAERTDSVLGDYSIDSDGDTTECMIQRYRGPTSRSAPRARPSSAPRADPRSPARPRSPSRPSRASPGSGRSRSSAGRGPRGR